MKLDLTDALYALSNALDKVQEEMGEISNQHGKNVAFISCIMGKYLNYDNHLLNDLVGLAILHDNAFTEYVREEYNNGNILDYDELKTKLEEIVKLRDGFLKAPRHCVVGERNIKLIPFYNDVTNVILYHHENAEDKAEGAEYFGGLCFAGEHSAFGEICFQLIFANNRENKAENTGTTEY